MKKFTTLDEVNQTVELLKQKPDIDAKVKYYKEVILASSELVESIEEKLSSGKEDKYSSAKLKLEKIEAENQLYYNQQYFENWLSRTRDYDAKWSEVTKDCEANYDTIMAEAEVVKKSNLRLANMVDSYVKSGNTDSKIKTEFFLYVKQEIENYKKHRKVTNILTTENQSQN
jgi:hypothetical protein